MQNNLSDLTILKTLFFEVKVVGFWLAIWLFVKKIWENLVEVYSGVVAQVPEESPLL